MSDTFTVLKGERGATRVTRTEFATMDEALRNAQRWSESNSTGDYWSMIRDAQGETVARFNLGTVAIASEVR